MKNKGLLAIGIALIVLFIGGCIAAYSLGQTKPQDQVKTKHAAQLPKSAASNNPNLILVNKKHPLKQELGFKKVEMNGIPVSQTIQEPLERFMHDAQSAGYPATLVSGYRSKAYQEQVFNQNYEQNVSQGMSHDQALKATKGVIQTPGSSEHETGLAVDVMTNQYWDKYHNLEAKSDQMAGQKWLIKHAPDYGFVLRYVKSPEGRKSTGIDYESWHFRYVGVENAKYMTKHHLTLEQYDQMIKDQHQN
ncbi:M15 family metallopeptidase [Weissella viridescens]|uniref:M15 family metallopeptidase n=1 Tax=Weissella viridescens TaxID=1629 RepID=UPI003AF2B874